MCGEGFRYIDHPSDIGVEVEGKSLEELFLNAAQAMLSIIADSNGAGNMDKPIRKTLRVEEDSAEELLHSFLTEILWLIGTQDFFPRAIRFRSLSETSVDAELSGGPLEKEALKNEIKAVTYHQLKVRTEGEKLVTRIIFDV
jgi:SHS2 domain-containing protein